MLSPRSVTVRSPHHHLPAHDLKVIIGHGAVRLQHKEIVPADPPRDKVADLSQPGHAVDGEGGELGGEVEGAADVVEAGHHHQQLLEAAEAVQRHQRPHEGVSQRARAGGQDELPGWQFNVNFLIMLQFNFLS